MRAFVFMLLAFLMGHAASFINHYTPQDVNFEANDLNSYFFSGEDRTARGSSIFGSRWARICSAPRTC